MFFTMTSGHTFAWGLGQDNLLTPCYDYYGKPDGFQIVNIIDEFGPVAFNGPIKSDTKNSINNHPAIQFFWHGIALADFAYLDS